MKKLDWQTRIIFSSLALLFVTGSFASLPSVAAANTSVIVADPDPCLIPNGPAGAAADTAKAAALTASGLATVPVQDTPGDLLLINIRSNVCALQKATTAVKDKTVGPTVFGIPVPFLSWDALGKIAMQVVLNKLTNSTVAWINSGFNDNPQFITDPTSYFANIANGFAGDLINVVANSNMCSPFKAQVVLALQNQYGVGTYNPQCTLTGIGSNLEDFYDNFSKGGGWNTWFSMTQNSNNNPYGAYLNAQDQINLGVANSISNSTLEASWGQGFLSSQSCSDGSKVTYDSYQRPTCQSGTLVTSTPGSVIQSQLENVLGQGVANIGLARSFDDVVSALVNQLATKVFSSTSGLFSADSKNGYTDSGTGNLGGTPQDFGVGSNPASSVSCSPDKTFALTGDTVTWTASAPQVDGLSFSYVWGGDEVLPGNTGTTLLQQYNTEGVKNAELTVTSVQDAVGGTATSTQTGTVICGTSVTVSKYNPLSVTCSPSATHAEINTNVTWTATITGGSGQFTKIYWGGSQAVAPGTNNVFIFPSYNNIPNPTVPTFTWPWSASKATSGITTQTFKDNGDGTMTEALQRIYVRDPAGKLGNVSADVTVEDADPELQPVDAQCGSVLIDEPQ